MNNIIKIDNVKEESFQVTWDVGRRCNYDCTYCPSHRHDNFSPHAGLETLIDTFDFVLDYYDIIKKYTRVDQMLSISFTGGEPTNNPNFLKMIRHVKEHPSYKDKDFKLSLTTNGAFSEQYANQLIDLGIGATISYHCEADEKLKKNVVDRIYQFSRRTKSKCNLMFHVDYFDECVDLANRFIKDRILFVPRLIGEPGRQNLPYTHTYSDKQMLVFKDFFNKSKQLIKDIYAFKSTNKEKDQHEIGKQVISRVNEIEKPISTTNEIKKTISTTNKNLNTASNFGRPCCGGRIFGCKTDSGTTEKTNFIKDTRFKGWKCMVNWHWLHIEQQTDQIFHHQTCQATFNTSTGAIGKISESNILLEKLRKQLETGKMPVIVCSRETCGCGLCLSKAKNDEDIKRLFHSTVKGLEPLIGEKLY